MQGALRICDSSITRHRTATVEDFVQQTSSSLNIDLGGTGTGDFDALKVLSNSQLDGTLNVALASGSSLAGGQQFKFLNVDGTDFLVWQRNPNVGELSVWQNNYRATALAASATPVPEPTAQVMLISARVFMYGRKPTT